MKRLFLILYVYSLPAIGDSKASSARAWRYFHPSWNVESEQRLPIPTSELVRLAFDPHKRTEESFRVTEPILDRVVFWMRIYGQFSSWMKVVHDSRDPRIIYGYIDFSPLYSRKLSRIAREILKQRIEKSVVAQLRTQLGDSRSEMWKYFLAQFHVGSKDGLHAYARRVRTQIGQRDIFVLALHRSPSLLHEMETIFRDRGLPGGLTRLPFVESSFNPDARSKTGAVGIWQFMPRTARAYIHRTETDRWIDPILQTRAAARLLEQNRRALPDWGTTVTSYNSGVGRIHKLVRKHQIDSVDELLNIQKLPMGFAGKNFYSEFLAALFVEAYKDTIFSGAIFQEDRSFVFAALSPIPDLGCMHR